MRFEITKCHGSGNDFPLIDARAITLEDEAWRIVAQALADRAGAIGGDGILLLNQSDETAFAMRMFNADGSEAETCLNGLRCVARAGFAAFGLTQAEVQLATSCAHAAVDEPVAPGVTTIRVTAGPADLDVTHWPLIGAGACIVDQPIAMLQTARTFTTVAMPNPHLISFVSAIDDAELAAIGVVCEAAPAWLPNRANVSFVEIRGADLFVRTFERGVGLTDSCGSAMAAATYAACRTGRGVFGTERRVFNRGGVVRAQAESDGMVSLSGNATFEWIGAIEIDTTTGETGPLTVTQRFDDEIAAWNAVLATTGRAPAA